MHIESIELTCSCCMYVSTIVIHTCTYIRMCVLLYTAAMYVSDVHNVTTSLVSCTYVVLQMKI